MTRQFGRAICAAVLAAALSGCHHKTAPPVVPVPPATPVPVSKPADTAGTVPTVPTVPPPLTPVEVPAKKVKRRKKPVTSLAGTAPAAPAANAEAAPAATAPAGAAVIGAITPGGDESSEKYRQARELIASLDRQLSGLSANLQQSQGEQIARIVHFNQEAQRALKGGDADGAVTLATKAKLLLDDLTK